MSNSDLPKGWVIAKIGDVAAKAVQRAPANDDEFIYVDIGSINRDLKIISEPQKLLGKDAPSRARKVINTGDILVSLTRPNLNAVALVGRDLDNQIASTGFEVIKPIIVDSRYIFSIVRSNPFIEAISGKVQGALYPAAKSDDVRGYEFFLPPLPEQHQIAAKLDDLLAQVGSIKTRLDAIPKILKRFRQSVLAAAVSGKLTEDWRGLHGFQLDWKEFKLGDVVKIDRGSSPRPIKEYITESDDGVNWIKIGDANDSDKYITSTREKITREGATKSRHVLPGDFILSNSMSLGRAYIMKIEGYVHDGWFVLRLPSYVNSDFFYYLLTSSSVQDQFTNLAVGGVVQNIRSELVKQALVKIPSLEEQVEIANRVEQFFSYADLIEQRGKDAQARVNHLTQSILAKAFRGELTADWRAQNPDLISGDNSAEALLKRIQQERTAENTKSKTTKVKKKSSDSMTPKQIISVYEVLNAAGRALSGQELLANAGYPSDASTQQLEQFFLDIRQQLELKTITRNRRENSDQDWFEVNTPEG